MFYKKRASIVSRQKGASLFIAIMLSFIGLLIIGGLITAWYRLTHIIFPIKTYSSVKEAAGGGIKLLSTYIDQGVFSEMERGNCPQGTSLIGNNTLPCCQVNLKYKLLGGTREYANPIAICFLGYVPQPGYEITGVAYTSQPAKFGKNFIYGFNSTAYGPNNITAYVEAVYVR